MKTPHIMSIALEMRADGLPNEMMVAFVHYGMQYRGVKSLMEMWYEEDDESEKSAIISDIKDLVQDFQRTPNDQR